MAYPSTEGKMKDWSKVEPAKTRIMNKHFTPGRGGNKIEYIVLHHVAGILTTDQVWNVWQSRQASAHYIVEVDGTVGQLVWDRDTAWANANATANARSLTIEHSNSAGSGQDWPISAATRENGARLVAALCLFYKLGRPQSGKNVRYHVEFTQTSCPYHLRPGWKYNAEYIKRAQWWYDHMASGGNTPSTPSTPGKGEITVSEADRIIKHLTDFIKGYVGPIGQDTKDVRAQLTGGRNTIVRNGKVDVAASYPGWPQLGQNDKGANLSVVDAIAALRQQVANVEKRLDELGKD